MRNQNSSHPKALAILFLTEMWERYGFYVVQGLLVLYMTKYFGYSDDASYSILGLFSALAYISPFGGGFLADRLLGAKPCIIVGGFFLILGYALLALPFAKLLFYPALATIIVGNGMFKPNISNLLGAQYDTHDTKRDAGFTIYYIGINIGAFLAGLSSGYIKDYFSWRMSFAVASAGLVIGLCTFLAGLRYIKANQKQMPDGFKFKMQFLCSCFLAIIAVTFLLRVQMLANLLLPVSGVILLIYLAVLIANAAPTHRKNMFVLSTLIVFSIVFWALEFQIFFAGNLFVDRLVDKHLFGLPLTTTIFYGMLSVFIIILGPFFAYLWNKLSHHGKNPSAVTKFILSMIFAGLGFLVLAISTYFQNQAGLISPLWVFLSYLLITIGELLLSPVGLSAVTTLAPASLSGIMMGIWFVATGFGGLFASLIAKFASVNESAQTITQKLSIYQSAFLDFAYLAFFVAIVLFFVQLTLNKLSNTAD